MNESLRNTILICIVSKQFFFLVVSHRHTAVDFDDMSRQKKKERTSFKGQHMLFENKYNSMMMMMMMMISVLKLFFHFVLTSMTHDIYTHTHLYFCKENMLMK